MSLDRAVEAAMQAVYPGSKSESLVVRRAVEAAAPKLLAIKEETWQAMVRPLKERAEQAEAEVERLHETLSREVNRSIDLAAEVERLREERNQWGQTCNEWADSHVQLAGKWSAERALADEFARVLNSVKHSVGHLTAPEERVLARHEEARRGR